MPTPPRPTPSLILTRITKLAHEACECVPFVIEKGQPYKLRERSFLVRIPVKISSLNMFENIYKIQTTLYYKFREMRLKPFYTASLYAKRYFIHGFVTTS